MKVKKKFINSRKLIDAGILAAVFVVAVIGFSYFTNRGNDNMTADIGGATCPQVSFSYDGYNLNTLPGYTKKMDIPRMRDTITPVDNQKLDVNIKAYDNEISQVRFTVYTLDGQEKLLEKKEKSPKESISLELAQEGLLSEERVLQTELTIGGDTIYYYTRVADTSNNHADACLNYASAFHENALAKVDGSGIETSLETDEEGDNSTFWHVNLHSDYDQVTWGELEPAIEGGERFSIKETNGVCTSVEIEYRVRCKGEENEGDIYKVKEFFRIRYQADTQQIYLLDYDRTMDQVFNPTKKVLSEKGLLLGITQPKVQYMVNGDGSAVSFVQADELWNYNKKTDEISLVFSFADAENTDPRNMTAKHEIKLLSADEDGSTTFAVCGYMNRGAHEGEVGVAIYHYDIGKNAVDEKAFISTDESYGSAVLELGKLIYYNVDTDRLYVMVDGTLYRIAVSRDKKEILAEGLEEGQYVIAADGSMAAYQTDGALTEAKEIKIINFADESEQTINGKEGECIRPLGFMKNDFVYGTAKTEDVGKTISGDTVVPLYKVEIQNSKGKVIKTYEQQDIYVLDAAFEDTIITLQRAVKQGETYNGVAEDYITNNEEKEESNIYLESYVTELKETQQRLTYADGISDKEPKILKPKQTLVKNLTSITFERNAAKNRCYVYGYGELQGICKNAGAAIQEANKYNGVVISEKQSYIWERGNRDLRYGIDGKEEEIQSIQDKLKGGEAPIAVMNDLSEDGSIDLTGCTTEQLLYVINQGTPIIAMLDASNSVVLTGYTESTVSYKDTASGEQRSTSYEEMDAMTQGSGHTYIGYVK